MLTLTKFSEGKAPIDSIYDGNEGAHLMALFDADEHINNGGWCMLDDGHVAQFLDRPIFKR
jgi:hypothetical protein